MVPFFRYTGESGVSRIEDGYLKNPDSEKPIQVVKGSYSYIGPDEKVMNRVLRIYPIKMLSLVKQKKR